MDKDGDTRNEHGHTAAKPGKGSIPSGVVIALYCTPNGHVHMQECITPDIIATRVLECAYPPVPVSDIDDDEDQDGKGGGHGHGEVLTCVSPCFNCIGPGGVACCCNCPPKT
jgi:hypothetical protein